MMALTFVVIIAIINVTLGYDIKLQFIDDDISRLGNEIWTIYNINGEMIFRDLKGFIYEYLVNTGHEISEQERDRYKFLTDDDGEIMEYTRVNEIFKENSDKIIKILYVDPATFYVRVLFAQKNEMLYLKGFGSESDIIDLKKQIKLKLHYRYAVQRIYFNNELLDDEESLSHLLGFALKLVIQHPTSLSVECYFTWDMNYIINRDIMERCVYLNIIHVNPLYQILLDLKNDVSRYYLRSPQLLGNIVFVKNDPVTTNNGEILDTLQLIDDFRLLVHKDPLFVNTIEKDNQILILILSDVQIKILESKESNTEKSNYLKELVNAGRFWEYAFLQIHGSPYMGQTNVLASGNPV